MANTYDITIDRIGAQGPPGPRGPRGFSDQSATASATASPTGVHVFTTPQQSVITVTTENLDSPTISAPALPIEGVVSIADTGPGFAVTFDTSIPRTVTLVFQAADANDSANAIVGISVGFIPFGIAAGDIPTDLSGLQNVPYGPQEITFTNTEGQTLYLLLDDTVTDVPIITCNCFQIIPERLTDMIMQTDANGVDRTYNIYSLGVASRMNQTFEIVET